MQNLIDSVPGARFEVMTDEQVRQAEAEILSHVTKEPLRGLNELIERRRHEKGIIDEAFRFSAVYDRIFVWQLPLEEGLGGRFSKDSPLYMPDNVKKRSREEAARGIIVSAGPKAMDILVSNAMVPGTVITHVKNVPWRIPIGKLLGKDIYLFSMNVGDIVGNEDIARAERAGEIELRLDSTSNEHFYFHTKTGERWNPLMPWIPEDS